MPCKIDGCDNPHTAKGLCSKHYQRFWKHGDPLETKATPPGEAREYYLEAVMLYEGKDCLIWPFARDEKGYARLGSEYVSRLLCDEVYGEAPTPDHQAAHSCGKGHEGCVAKGHLSWKTRAENQADRIAHDTHKRGERSHLAKLKQNDVLAIRSLKGREPMRSVAKRYGVSRSTVCGVMNGNSWSWL